ncbi:IS21 family transposase [Dongshaea marina]|uniref:IS21 family transposase n=1 Tax=Dongshaea marina TaxID=2047966 RepID=UPI000D3E8958|nr:IS21 family transposase [Dongshaea marina]
MPTVHITMRKLKEILRLKYQGGLSHRQIASSLSVSPSTVSNYCKRAQQMGLCQWPLPAEWDEERLRREFLETRITVRQTPPLPDWAVAHQELRRKGMTLQLLWEEYAERHPKNHYSYNHYCMRYREWRKCQSPSMRQSHKAGEKLFVDYCGPTVPIVDPRTGEERRAQIFVAVMGASSYTYADATLSQGLEDWVMSHKRAFEFLGGVPEMIVPDNLKSGVSRACRYEPDLNPTYQQLAAHYGVAVLPARPYKPKDKAKAEVGVQIVERWILAKLRHETFFSLAQLNQRIGALLTELNNRPFKKLPGSRKSQFELLDKPVLKSLPQNPYQFTRVKAVRVHIDYHIELDKHYYSVPYTLLKRKLEAHICDNLVRIYHGGRCVATHPRSYQQGGQTTHPDHMPVAHQKQMQWTPGRFLNWAQEIGPSTLAVIKQLLYRKSHPELGYRASLGILNLEKRYGRPRLEAACQRADRTGVYYQKGIRSILEKGLDGQPLPETQPDRLAELTHLNIRGSGYYH